MLACFDATRGFNGPFPGLADRGFENPNASRIMNRSTALPAQTSISEVGVLRATRPLKAACALIACCAIAIFAFRAQAGTLWLDELLTMTLVKARSLPLASGPRSAAAREEDATTPSLRPPFSS